MENFEEIQDEMWLERSKRWILLVDDEESIRKAVGQYLFDEGYQVTACADVDTALKVLQSGNGGTTANNNAADLENDETKSDRKQLPDAIISDICLTPQSSSTSPQINDGLKFLQFTRSHPQLVAIPVILLTAKGTIKDRIAGYDSGADAYLTKPFDPEELLMMVDNVITRHETLSGKNIHLDDLQQDLKEIKHFLLENGGASGIGNGWIQATNVYLTPAERNILKLLSQGLMNKEIAKEAFLSQRRVEQLLTSMFRKTGVSNRTELVRWAVSTGVVEL